MLLISARSKFSFSISFVNKKIKKRRKFCAPNTVFTKKPAQLPIERKVLYHLDMPSQYKYIKKIKNTSKK